VRVCGGSGDERANGPAHFEKLVDRAFLLARFREGGEREEE
jgi:hypothetical protein